MSSVYFYEPFFSFNDFQRLFGDLEEVPQQSRQVSRRQQSGDSHSAQRSPLSRGFQPKMDIHESPESNVVTASIELPGMKKEDIQIDVQANRLVISGQQTHEKDVNEKGYVLRERSSGRFWRALPLPAGTQVSHYNALALMI